MKIKRLKKVQKNLSFFVNNYKFRKPYQILIDGTFSFAALQNKFNIKEQLAKYFQADVKLLTTQCIIVETEKLGHKVYGAMLIVKQFPIHQCGHEKNTVTGSKCLRSMVGSNNESRYVIATQDRLLQEQLKKIPGVPIMYLHGRTPTLEAPSQKSREFAEQIRSKVTMTDMQEERIKSLKEQFGLKSDITMQPKKKHKKSGPNPLSCKRSQKKESNSMIHTSEHKVNESGKVRKRKRIKLPAHVKEVLKLNTHS
ncbi:PREDICTED: rRNA-processing protein UTP23 homolog [Ceratosolen solmsi marchali]|uniref:rRNA-processing protein UTP23 homolog n=1 Tax=Ceratosolen solmsi marchali TaxID=326594 RepID=A0AAJ6VMT9_9HYME|nr:PREDICTED: rRNA-processing protein UTP23 homolog [Ceratosolen solmsi marchali]